MNARLNKYFVSVALIAVLALAVLPASYAQEGTAEYARVRIGYFAFDPRDFDTFIDGEPALFGPGWDEAGWLDASAGNTGYVVCCTNTPFMDFSSGIHGFTFAPKGEGMDAAILGPQEVTFVAGHVYSLVIVGEIDDNSLTLLVIDETEVFSEADLSADFMGIGVHDLEGAPPVTVREMSSTESINVEYGQFYAGWSLGGSVLNISVSTAEDRPAVLFAFETVPVPAGISDLGGYIGSYPGQWGKDFFFAYDWGYPGEITVIDGGTVAPGDEISGEVAEVAQRVRYTLTVEADSVLNIYANGAGNSTGGYAPGGAFGPALYVYDAQGNLLLWNDEISHEDDPAGIGDAGMEGIALAAGTYAIEVGSGADLNSGPFKLIIKSAS